MLSIFPVACFEFLQNFIFLICMYASMYDPRTCSYQVLQIILFFIVQKCYCQLISLFIVANLIFTNKQKMKETFFMGHPVGYAVEPHLISVITVLCAL